MSTKVFIESLLHVPDQRSWHYESNINSDSVPALITKGLEPVNQTEGILLAQDLTLEEDTDLPVAELGTITVIVSLSDEEVIMKGTVEDPRSAFPAPEAQVTITSIFSKRKPTRVYNGRKANIIVSCDEDDYNKHLIDPASTAGTAYINSLCDRDNLSIMSSHTRLTPAGEPILASSSAPISFMRQSVNSLKEALATGDNEESNLTAAALFKNRVANQLDYSNRIIRHLLDRAMEEGERFTARMTFGELQEIFGISPDDILHGKYQEDSMFSNDYDQSQWIDDDLRKEVAERMFEVLRHASNAHGIATCSFTAQNFERDIVNNEQIFDIVNGQMMLYSSYGNSTANITATFGLIKASLPWIFGQLVGIAQVRVIGTNVLVSISINDYDNGRSRDYHYIFGIPSAEAVVMDTTNFDVIETSNKLAQLTHQMVGIEKIQPGELDFNAPTDNSNFI